jgi:hypothetical protein
MTDLTDRMRTCAAAIQMHKNEGPPWDEWDAAKVVIDAADLLIEASNIIEAAPAPLGAPMEIIPPVIAQSVTLPTDPWIGTWTAPGDTLPVSNPYRGRHTCPKCDSRAGKTVHRKDKQIWLECPACGTKWRI